MFLSRNRPEVVSGHIKRGLGPHLDGNSDILANGQPSTTVSFELRSSGATSLGAFMITFRGTPRDVYIMTRKTGDQMKTGNILIWTSKQSRQI